MYVCVRGRGEKLLHHHSSMWRTLSKQKATMTGPATSPIAHPEKIMILIKSSKRCWKEAYCELTNPLASCRAKYHCSYPCSYRSENKRCTTSDSNNGNLPSQKLHFFWSIKCVVILFRFKKSPDINANLNKPWCQNSQKMTWSDSGKWSIKNSG